jgi:nucleotide-binding universal stress UspA family protein
MPRIVTVRTKDESNQDVVSLVLSQDAISVGPDGDPWCGITLNAAQARALADRLCSYAAEIENREEQGYRTSTQSFVHLSSVVALHDGTQSAHRAFEAALHFASRSLAPLAFIGIFGISNATGEPSQSMDDYQWQKGWLTQLADMYGLRASGNGVSFTSRLFAANEPCEILDLMSRMDFDLIVMPSSLTRFGIHGERLMPSVVNRRTSNVLVCP